jgi:hypothetical protein
LSRFESVAIVFTLCRTDDPGVLMMFKKKGNAGVLAKLAETPAPFGEIGQRLHHLISTSAPELEPMLRWGVAFYVRDGEDICYLKPDKNLIVFGVGERLNPALEHGTTMHPVAWTVTSLDTATEEKISALVKTAAGQPNP